jgi:peptidoglycan/LPS O-acetylase OafA/YrhL
MATWGGSGEVRPARVQGLDVIRGVAVGLVMLEHAWPRTFPGSGVVGVTMFFALSGFLITGLLLGDIQRLGHIRYARFYVHRFFRLYPALVALLVGFCLIDSALDRSSIIHLAKSVVIGLFYLSDLPSYRLAPTAGLAHLWTLAVEEQFYLVWPWVLLFGIKTRRLGLTLLACIGAVIAVSIALPALTTIPLQLIYQSPTTWAIALLIGCAARIYRDRLARVFTNLYAFAAGCAALVALTFVSDFGHPIPYYLLSGPAVAIATVAIVFTAEKARVVGLSLQPLFLLGTISYAAYLWNFPISLWLPPRHYSEMPLGWGFLSIALTIAAATASWFTVEALGRRLRRRYDLKLAAQAGAQPTLRGKQALE